MLATERQTKIIEALGDSMFVSVEDLAKRLDVSAMTIRRDLDMLDRTGRLSRCHGGAVRMGVIREEEAYSEKRVCNLEAKRRIARACARLVAPGDIVYLDAGTTTYEIAAEIRDIGNLTVVTNDLAIAGALLGSAATLIAIGGVVQKETGSMIGRFAEDMLARLRATVAFIGTSSVDANFNLTSPTVEKSAIKNTAIEIAERAYLVADGSKFYKTALVKVVGLSRFAGVITDKAFSREEAGILGDMGIEAIHV